MLEAVTLSALTIRDDAAFAAMEVYGRLKARLTRDGYAFRVPARAHALAWEETLLLNVVFWNGATGEDVLEDRAIDADVVAHVAWHHVVRQALGEAADTADGMFLGEAVASAFDLYAAGRLLALGRDVGFLETQLPAMAEALENAGWDATATDALFARVAADPEGSFESLRQLLFDVGTALVRAPDAGAAAAVLRAHASIRSLACSIITMWRPGCSTPVRVAQTRRSTPPWRRWTLGCARPPSRWTRWRRRGSADHALGRLALRDHVNTHRLTSSPVGS